MEGPNGNGRDVLVASIGAPFNWGPVEYRALWSGDEEKPWICREESRTSLKLLAKTLKANETLVFVLDTLAAWSRYKRNQKTEECEALEEARCLPDPASLPQGILDPATYRSLLLNPLEDCIEQWFHGEGVDARVTAIPGFGEYSYLGSGCQSRAKTSWRLDHRLASKGGDPLSYQATLYLLHLVDLLWQGPEENGPVKLHIDLTHGLNYATYALYRAAMQAARVYAAASGSNVEVILYNSEPYVSGVKSLNVWRVKREKITPKSAVSRLFYTALAADRGAGRATFSEKNLFLTMGKPHQAIMNARAKLKNIVTPLIAEAGVHAALAVVIGAPLLLLQAGVEASQLMSRLGGPDPMRTATRLLLEALLLVKVEHGQGGAVEITHITAPNYGYVKKMLSFLALAYYAARAAGREDIELLQTGGYTIALAPVETLKSVAEKYIAGPAARIIAGQEVSLFEKAQGTDPKECSEMSRDYLKACCAAVVACRTGMEEKIEGGECKVDERVFVAHAGLQANCLVIKAECGEGKATLKLGYAPQNLKDIKEKAKNILEKAAKEIFEENEKRE